MKHVGRKCHDAAIQVAPGSSEAIAHGIGKHREVQKPLLISLHTDICLLLLLISLSINYSLCPDTITNLIFIFATKLENRFLAVISS